MFDFLSLELFTHFLDLKQAVKGRIVKQNYTLFL